MRGPRRALAVEFFGGAKTHRDREVEQRKELTQAILDGRARHHDSHLRLEAIERLHVGKDSQGSSPWQGPRAVKRSGSVTVRERKRKNAARTLRAL